MSLEMKLIENLNNIIDQFEDRLNEIKINIMDLQNNFFRQIEELQDRFTNFIKILLLELVEKINREEIFEENFDEENYLLLLDKDNILAVLNGSHEYHISIILIYNYPNTIILFYFLFYIFKIFK